VNQLVVYIRTKVDESAAFLEGKTRAKVKRHLSRDVLMFGGSFLSLLCWCLLSTRLATARRTFTPRSLLHTHPVLKWNHVTD